MKRWAIVCAAVLLLALGCARLTLPGWDPVRSMLSVRLGVTAATAFPRVMAAFSAEGQQIESANAEAGLTTVTRESHILLSRRSVTYHATVLRIGQDSSEVLLSGTDRIQGTGAPVVGPLTPNDGPFLVLARVAARLRGEPLPDSLAQVTRPLRQ